MALLTSSDDSVVKPKIELESKPIIIGRHPECDVQIDDGSVSRHHAQIAQENGNFYVQDLNSRNGTFLNNSAVHQPTKLYDGSEIRICDVRFTFYTGDQIPQQASPRNTIDAPSKITSSVIFDDDGGNSTVMSRLDVPSHYHTPGGKANADDKLQALIQIIHALSESVERDDILENILECLFELFTAADRGFIILKTSDGSIQPVGMKTRRPRDEEQIRISRTIVNQVMESKQSLISSDAAADSRFDMSQSIADFRIRSIMCAPLINSKDESIGVVQLDTLKTSIAFDEEDLEILVTVTLQASLAIQKVDLFEDVKKSDEIQNDLELAHELQQRFLPQRNPDIKHYEFFSYYRPMQQVGGDYFDYVQLSPSRIAVIVADVVGHGIAAAMLMAKVSAESRFALASEATALEAVQRMNDNLCGMNLDRFVTLVIGLIDTEKNNVEIVNAGHMPPIIRKSESGDVSMVAIEESGLPLGIMEDAEYNVVTFELSPGDTVVMYTDGINESMDADGNQLTTATLLKEIEESQTKTAGAIGKVICDAVSRHAGNQNPIDDMCLVCVGRK